MGPMDPPEPKYALVGEANPYGADPFFALYPYPEESAGGRLCRLVLRMRPADYLLRYRRVNLCAGRWAMSEAAASAGRLLHQPAYDWRCLVLLGAKVCSAFGVGFEPYSVVERDGPPPRTLVVLPHPSGRCRLWSVSGSFDRARDVLESVGATLT